ncbi:MAG: YkgJ family cysteine cluster protein [Candidatus Helarchaeota archaeon]
MKGFNCLRCGFCCYNILKDGYERYIPIYLDEIEKFRKIAKNRNINLKLEPDLLYPDILNKKLIIVTYVFKFEHICAFYKENIGCTIYEERPITCKAYPVAVWREDINYTMKVNTDCKFVEKNIDIISPKNYSELEMFFPNEYIQAKKLMIKGKEVIYRIIELEKQKKIDCGYLSGELDFFYDLQRAEVEYKNWEKINLYDIELD